MTDALRFFVLALATFRLTILLTKDKGPGWVMLRFRKWVDRKTPKAWHLDEGVECPWCASVWFGVIVGVTDFYCHSNMVYEILLLSTALSGAALILNQAFTKTS